MPSLVVSLLKKVDIFQIPISFLFDKQRNRSTILGIIGSLAIYTFMIYSFTQSDVFLKKSPVVVYQTLSNVISERIDFDSDKLLSFAVSDTFHNISMDLSLFHLKLTRQYFGINDVGVTTIKDNYSEILKPCTIEDVGFNTELFENSGLRHSFCLNNKTFSIQGVFTERTYSYFAVGIYYCDNKTFNNSCKSKEEIDKFFYTQRIYLAVSIHSSAVNVEHYENTMGVNYKGLIFSFDPRLDKICYVYLKTVQMTSDDGWLYEKKNFYSGFSFDRQEQDVTIWTEGQSFISYVFFSSNHHDKISRRYQKIPDMLGSFSGTAQFIIFFYFIITNFYCHIETMKKIVNTLYVFQSVKKIKPDKVIDKSMKKIDKSLKLIPTEIIKSKEKIEHNKIENQYINRIINSNEENNKNKTEESPDNIKKLVKIEDQGILMSNPDDFNEDEGKIIKKKIDQDDFLLEHYSKNFDENKENPHKTYQKETVNSDTKKSLPSNIDMKAKIIGDSINEEYDKTIETENFTLNPFEYLHYKFSSLLHIKKSEKQKLIKKAENYYFEHLDVIQILNKIQEIEKLKLALLDDDQLFLFNMIPKPKIYVDEKIERRNSSAAIMSQRILKYQNNADKEVRREKIRQNLIDSKNTKTTKRILNLLGENLNMKN